jgi:hypothetical protein
MPDETEQLIEFARLVIQRLERLSPDSTWARRSSGARGELLRWVEIYENCAPGGGAVFDRKELEALSRSIEFGFYLLKRAAEEY